MNELKKKKLTSRQANSVVRVVDLDVYKLFSIVYNPHPPPPSHSVTKTPARHASLTCHRQWPRLPDLAPKWVRLAPMGQIREIFRSDSVHFCAKVSIRQLEGTSMGSIRQLEGTSFWSVRQVEETSMGSVMYLEVLSM